MLVYPAHAGIDRFRTPFGPCWIPETELWRAAGLLARWFRFQPSEIDDLTVDDLRRWLDVAREQISESAR